MLFFSLHTDIFFLFINWYSFSLFFLPSSSSSSSLQNSNGWTALMRAAGNGHDTVIPLLLEADAQIDAQTNSGGDTPLMRASFYGKEAAVRELLKGNPNLDLKTKPRWPASGKTALDYARQELDYARQDKALQSIVDLLVDHERS